MEYVIRIKMGNAAFEDNPREVWDILEGLKDRTKEVDGQYLYLGSLQDSNGNTVGVAQLVA